MHTNHRVVITGVGVVTALGSSKRQFWEGLLAGKSGIRRITQFDASDLPCQIAGEIPDFDAGKFMDRKEARRNSRSAQIALAAAIQAVDDAGLPETMKEPEDSGVIFGTAIGGFERFDEGITTLRSKGLSKLNPFVIPSGIPNLPSFLVSRQFQCLGPTNTIATACATGTQAVGEGMDYIRYGKAKLMIAGGCEALIRDFSIAGFSAMRALPVNFNDNPQAASRPFDAKREGFIFSEGAAALVLEELEHARQRNATIYAEVLGHASSSDGYHVAAPEPEARGPIRAIRWALKDAHIEPFQVDYINAHGTSTPLNDITETHAIKTVFGDHARKLAISSTKSMVGHAMGASGALETIVCALTIKNQLIHPTINYEYPDPECDLDYVPNHCRKADVKIKLSNSFGLGGQNACVILRKYEE
jgi:beta-ketoacyl-acyl-carrier-protein synthase II